MGGLRLLSLFSGVGGLELGLRELRPKILLKPAPTLSGNYDLRDARLGHAVAFVTCPAEGAVCHERQWPEHGDDLRWGGMPIAVMF